MEKDPLTEAIIGAAIEVHRVLGPGLLEVAFFESNGGQAKTAEATLPDIRLAVAETELDVGLVDTVLEALSASCYYLTSELREAVWRTYKHLLLLGKDNKRQPKDLGLVHSSAASELVSFFVNRLRGDGDVEPAVSPTFLARHWPAMKEWSTKAVRDAFFASPLFPRLLDGDSVKETIARGVENSVLAYVGKDRSGRYEPFLFGTSLAPDEVEISDEMFVLTAEEAKKHIEPPRLTTLTVDSDGVFQAGPDEGNFLVMATAASIRGTADVAVAKPGVVTPTSAKLPVKQDPSSLSWEGNVPAQKWMNFYTKVLSKFAAGKGLRLTVRFELSCDGSISQQRIEETKAALSELGLNDDVITR